jgi:MraZ protein
LIPPLLRGLAGLNREAIVVGALDRIEVWAPDAWADFLRDSERLLEDVTLDVSWPLPERAKTTPPEPGSTAKP